MRAPCLLLIKTVGLFVFNFFQDHFTKEGSYDYDKCSYITMHTTLFFKDGEFHFKLKDTFDLDEWAAFFSSKRFAATKLHDALKSVKAAYQAMVPGTTFPDRP